MPRPPDLVHWDLIEQFATEIKEAGGFMETQGCALLATDGGSDSRFLASAGAASWAVAVRAANGKLVTCSAVLVGLDQVPFSSELVAVVHAYLMLEILEVPNFYLASDCKSVVNYVKQLNLNSSLLPRVAPGWWDVLRRSSAFATGTTFWCPSHWKNPLGHRPSTCPLKRLGF